MRTASRILVIGAGFAGTNLVRALARTLPADVTLTLLSDESYTTFNPMLPEAVGASVFPEHVVAPLRELLDQRRGDRFVMGRVTDVDRLWALGDCALVPNGFDGQASPPTAQFAVRQARLLARNLLARPRGMMAAIGRHNGVAEVLGVGFSGLPAWLLWRAYYLSQMPTLRRKLRIWVEWTWGMFFPADITHLRFTRSGELPVHERSAGV